MHFGVRDRVCLAAVDSRAHVLWLGAVALGLYLRCVHRRGRGDRYGKRERAAVEWTCRKTDLCLFINLRSPYDMLEIEADVGLLKPGPNNTHVDYASEDTKRSIQFLLRLR